MISTGTFQRSLDDKLRVLLPKRIRLGLDGKRDSATAAGVSEELEPSDSMATALELYLTPGTDSCLELHTSTSLEELAQQARQNRPGTQNLKSFLRLFYARAHACDIDSQGRIRIPKELADLAGLDKEIVIVGVGFHWEVWDGGRWQAYLNQNHQQFDSIVETALDEPLHETVHSESLPNQTQHPARELGRLPK